MSQCRDPCVVLRRGTVLIFPSVLAVGLGGRGFCDPPRAATLSAVSKWVQHHTKLAGLPQAGLYALRRDAGSHVGTVIILAFSAVLMVSV